jgi:hypothetical protein
MADVESAQVVCLTTPTLLVQADTDGCRLVIHKEQNHIIYLGGAAVSTSNGFRFDHDATLDIHLPPNAKLYGTSTSGTETAYILKIGNA